MDGFASGGIDSTTWQALGLTLTLLGLVVSVAVWRRRGPASGLRAVAWSLLPLAAGLTGVLRLGWRIADAVVDWAARLVFGPVVWLGLVVAAVSGMLFVASGLLRRRGAGRSPAAAVPPASRRTAVASRPGAPAGPSAPAAGTAAPGDDLADIEALLRKHGIT